MMRTHFIDDTKTKQVRLIVRGKVLSRTIFKSKMRWSDFYSLLGVGIGFIITFVIDIRSIRSNQWTKRHRQYFFSSTDSMKYSMTNEIDCWEPTIENWLLVTICFRCISIYSRENVDLFLKQMNLVLESACAVRIVSCSRELHNNSKHCSSVQK